MFAYRRPVDMRKGFEGLGTLVKQAHGKNPLSGALYLFTNRRRTTAKVLHFDGTGLGLYTKRLARGRFAPLWDDDAVSLSLTRAELELFLQGSQLVGTSDAFVARLDGDGELLWARRFGDNHAQTSDSVRVHGDGVQQWLAALTAVDGAPATTARPTDPAGLHAAAACATSGRERFLLRRELARACAAAGRPDVAAHLLAALRDEARPLAAWEPALLADCLSELLRCGRTLDNEARTRLGLDHALAELSAHDPPVALALGRDTPRP